MHILVLGCLQINKFPSKFYYAYMSLSSCAVAFYVYDVYDTVFVSTCVYGFMCVHPGVVTVQTQVIMTQTYFVQREIHSGKRNKQMGNWRLCSQDQKECIHKLVRLPGAEIPKLAANPPQ